MTSWLVSPLLSTGNNRQIELLPVDLLSSPTVNMVFVYPSDLDMDQLKDALSRSLSRWPLVAGRFLSSNDGHYYIKMSDNAIPLIYAENNELTEWPGNLNVVVDYSPNPLIPFIDYVQVIEWISGLENEPLIRLKVTHLIQSGEFVLGISWAHILGDGESCLKFLNRISCFYQQLEPLGPLPVFERRIWREEEVDQSLYLRPEMKSLIDAKLSQENTQLSTNDQETHDQLNLVFSGEQLSKLRELAGGNIVTIQDALSAYIILTLNTYCYRNDDRRIILRTKNVINYRGVSTSIAPIEQVGNAFTLMLSDEFVDPFSLSNIAKTNRRSIIKSRDAKFLEAFLATRCDLMRKTPREKFLAHVKESSNQMMINSQLRYDWANLVDFGYTDKCRFYTRGENRLCLRVNRINPVHNGNVWLPRDQTGAEVAFLIEKNMKQKFINAWHKDIIENFENVKQ